MLLPFCLGTKPKHIILRSPACFKLKIFYNKTCVKETRLIMDFCNSILPADSEIPGGGSFHTKDPLFGGGPSFRLIFRYPVQPCRLVRSSRTASTKLMPAAMARAVSRVRAP